MKEINPLTDPELYARAEKVALAVLASPNTAFDRRRRLHLMDKAASEVFRAAGATATVADFYATCITCDLLERAEVLRQRRQSSQHNS